MSNAFGNSGWIQSSIDHSRGKTRPKERRRRAAASDAARRQQTLENDPLYKKYGGGSSKPAASGFEAGYRRGFVRLMRGILGSVPRGTG